MKSILKKLSLMVSSLVLVAGVALAVAPLSAQAAVSCDSGVGKGVALTGSDNNCIDSGEGEGSLAGVIKNVINIFSIVVGAVSVIMIIVGGFRYIVSNGDSTAVTGAKNSILYAIVGLVIVLFAQVIVRFVLTNATTSA